MVAYVNINGEEFQKEEIPKPEEETILDKDIIGTIEDNNSISNYNIENLENVLAYLDPYEVSRYSDLLTLYATYIPTISYEIKNYDEFYKTNREMIRKILGIYKSEDFKIFHRELLKQNVSTLSNVKDLNIVNINKKNGNLKVDFEINYDTGLVKIENYINYVYINGKSNLFIYHFY